MREVLSILLNDISIILYNLVGVIGCIILLWALWQLMQILRNLKEYGIDYIGFYRGELYYIAKKHKITILKPQMKKPIHSLIWEGKNEV